MAKIVHAIDGNEIRQGLFIPLDLFTEQQDIEVEITDDGVVTIRTRERSLTEVRRSMDRRREALKSSFGLMEDSSILIREDRDSR